MVCRKFPKLILMAVIVCSVLATSTFAVKVTAKTNVNVRAKASTSSAVRSVMKKGMSRTILKTSKSGKWVKVRVNGKEGYVQVRYMKKDASSYSFDLQTNYPYTAYRDSSGRPYGATISSGGCCPTSVGNILRNLCSIREATTRNVCSLATTSGARYDGGTAPKTLLKAAKKKWGGFTYKYTTSDSQMKTHVKNGGMALAHTWGGYSGPMSLFSSGGHFIAMIDSDGSKMTVLDPYYTANKWTQNSYRRANVTQTSTKGMVYVNYSAVAAACDYYYLISDT